MGIAGAFEHLDASCMKSIHICKSPEYLKDKRPRSRGQDQMSMSLFKELWAGSGFDCETIFFLEMQNTTLDREHPWRFHACKCYGFRKVAITKF